MDFPGLPMLASKKYFKAGEVIVRENTQGSSAYIVESGKVEVSRNIGRQRIVFTELGPGAIFGEMCLIDEAPRSATVTAKEETTVTVLGKNYFQQAMNQLSPAVLTIFKVIASRLRETDILINPLKLSNFYYSLCGMLYYLARAEGVRQPGGELNLSFSQTVEQCCTILALEKDLVEKVINRLAFTRLVRLDKGKSRVGEEERLIIFPDIENFKSFVDFLCLQTHRDGGENGYIEFLPDKTFEMLSALSEKAPEFTAQNGRIALSFERCLEVVKELLGYPEEQTRKLFQPLLDKGLFRLSYDAANRSSLLVCPDSEALKRELANQTELRLFKKMVHLLKNLAS
jgi:CRP/FNR family transcriptional regulator, cyclic AMP receptor protein